MKSINKKGQEEGKALYRKLPGYVNECSSKEEFPHPVPETGVGNKVNIKEGGNPFAEANDLKTLEEIYNKVFNYDPQVRPIGATTGKNLMEDHKGSKFQDITLKIRQ